MKIAVLGGGMTGLTTAYRLSKAGYVVTLFEKSPTLGGLARGFKTDEWEWPLEYAYHHIFSNDSEIIQFAQEIGFKGIYFRRPKTSSLYGTPDNYRIFPVDSPQDFLRFPLLGIPDKIRGAFFLGILKFFPLIPYMEKISAKRFVQTFMGKSMWNIFFEQLFRKKFGKNAGNICASFLWARIHKRTPSLGYMTGGFQAFVDHIEKACVDAGVEIRKQYTITSIVKEGSRYSIDGDQFDCVVATTPSHVIVQSAQKVLNQKEIRSLSKLSHLHARVVILETDKPFLTRDYWLNICTPSFPAMVVAQHTQFVEPSHYNNKHITYIGWYDSPDAPIFKKPTQELVDELVPQLNAIERQEALVERSFSFVGPYSQPLYTRSFLKNKPTYRTSSPGFYIANLDMTYPYDRGTNYAVLLGMKVADMIKKDFPNK